MTTYSFQDVDFDIAHADLGDQYSISGDGVGSIAFAMSNERTAHDVAADGAVMVSKIKAKNGTIVIQIQQTSPLHKWLLKLFNKLQADSSSTTYWAGIKTVLRAPKMGDQITATGVSFQKQADRGYKSQGEQVSWTLMAAEIQQDVI